MYALLLMRGSANTARCNPIARHLLQALVCPICCDSQLDRQEEVEPYCGCGYQMCSFCLNKIQTEGDSICECLPLPKLDSRRCNAAPCG